MRIFNIAGPVDPKEHYYVPHRLDEVAFLRLIEEKKYFVLHAPRQSGKTTAIRIFTQQLNAAHQYQALYVNVEPAQAARSDVKHGMEIILNRLRGAGKLLLDSNDLLFTHIEKALERVSGGSLQEVLQEWSGSCNKPIVLFIDEIDSLVGDTLISVLRQLRAGYPERPDNFPQSMCLIGVRDVRDYRIWSESENNMVLGGSAFNIKAESLVLHNFSLEQVCDLYGQHTQETGQNFTDEAIEYAYYLTQGQPWLINALAYQACFEDVTDRSKPITKDVIDRAKETLILRRDTHIDQLIHKLHEPRVRHIIDAIISGTGQEEVFKTDDLQYVRDLGLISQKGMKIANPIYQEVIPRELAYAEQEGMQETVPKVVWYQNEDSSLNMHKLLQAFAQFYRENSDVWLEKFNYKESGPHLLLMAFLQRVINGGGKIHREYALGRKRVDLLLEWPTAAKASFAEASSFAPLSPRLQSAGKATEDTSAGKRAFTPERSRRVRMSGDKAQQRIVIELKIKRGEKTITEGLEQTAGYMDLNNGTEGHLVVFDRTVGKPWDEKIFVKEHVVGKYTIIVWGM